MAEDTETEFKGLTLGIERQEDGFSIRVKGSNMTCTEILAIYEGFYDWFISTAIKNTCPCTASRTADFIGLQLPTPPKVVGIFELQPNKEGLH